MHTARRRRERGQTLMVFALAFALFLFSLVCLVADSAFLFRWSGRVESAAQLAAQSGADSVDPRYLYGSDVRCPHAGMTQPCHATIVDVSAQDRVGSLYAFERACIQTGDQSAGMSSKRASDPQSPEGTRCASDGCRVWAVVTRAVDLPIPFPGFPEHVTVAANALAAPVAGATRPRGGCTAAAWVPSTPP